MRFESGNFIHFNSAKYNNFVVIMLQNLNLRCDGSVHCLSALLYFNSFFPFQDNN